jgi:hypothetical protein
VAYKSERELEARIRSLILEHITTRNPTVYTLKNKKAVDILICQDGPKPELFFIEVKYHQTKHGRLGFGGSKGGGFQPEIVSRKPAYFEKNLRWVLACEEHEANEVLFLTSEIVREYLAGGVVAEKFNNFQKKIFKEQAWLNEQQFVEQLQLWLGVTAAEQSLNTDGQKRRVGFFCA